MGGRPAGGLMKIGIFFAHVIGAHFRFSLAARRLEAEFFVLREGLRGRPPIATPTTCGAGHLPPAPAPPPPPDHSIAQLRGPQFMCLPLNRAAMIHPAAVAAAESGH